MQDIGLWRLTDQGESPVATGGRRSNPHTGGGEEARLYRYRKQSIGGRNYLAGPTGLLSCTQHPNKLADFDCLWARSLNVAVYFLIHFYLTVSTLHSSDLLTSRIKEISFIFLLDQHVHKYPNAKRVNL